MKKVYLSLMALSMGVFMLTLSGCHKDEDHNKADISFTWTGSDDFLSVVKPIVTWWVYPHKTTGEDSIKATLWKKDLHFEDFDSLLVYAVVTYPKPNQLPNAIGREFTMTYKLSGLALGFDDSHKAGIPSTAETDPGTKIVLGEQLDSYLNSLSGIIQQVGFVVYRDGRVREKEKDEELNWRK